VATTQSQTATSSPSGATASSTSGFSAWFEAICDNLGRAIQGKPEAIRLVVLCMLSEGHLLVEDVPGVGKTSLAKALARSIDGVFGRVQFTPDLLPSDVVGVNIWDRNRSAFEFRPGPIFANIVLGDEINRASPKTQSALLEAMAERQVTVDGVSYELPPPFMVIATENPIEHEGTYPLPDSQLDRFLMRVGIGYPSRQAEIDVLSTHGDRDALDDVQPVVTADQILTLAAAVREVGVAPSLRGYLVDLAEATRRHPHLALGMSPRATLALQRASRALAASLGRSYVIPDDVKELVEPVLAHRVIVAPDAQVQGITAADVMDEILRELPVPTGVRPG
jgi:MoxR-like ATPase